MKEGFVSEQGQVLSRASRDMKAGLAIRQPPANHWLRRRNPGGIPGSGHGVEK